MKQIGPDEIIDHANEINYVNPLFVGISGVFTHLEMWQLDFASRIKKISLQYLGELESLKQPNCTYVKMTLISFV